MHWKRRKIIHSLLEEISCVGDTCENHKEIVNYEPFLEMQLEILDRIVATEKRITRLRSEVLTDSNKIEEAKEYRRLLKLLGTTIAWILLEYNRPYIRHMASGHDSGYLHGKQGLMLERIALKASFKNDRAGILHDITNCLLIGDLSVIDSYGVRFHELKLVKKGRKKDRREIRQERKAKEIWEFYDKGTSTTIRPGWTYARHIAETPDKHNFEEVSAVISESLEKGFGFRVVEECLVYYASRGKTVRHQLFDFMESHFGKPEILFGCHDRHIAGLPKGFCTFPFTCFDIPTTYKRMLLFGEIVFCVFLDVTSLQNLLLKEGFECEIVRTKKTGVFEIANLHNGKFGPCVVGRSVIDRLLYECLSVETFVNYLEIVPPPTHERGEVKFEFPDKNSLPG